MAFEYDKSMMTDAKGGLISLAFRKLGNKFYESGARFAMHNWSPYSRLFLKDDGGDWVLSREMQSFAKLYKMLNINIASPKWRSYAKRQSIFYASRYELFRSRVWEQNRQHRFATVYFHGRPGSGEPIFDELHEALCNFHSFIHRVQVTHTEMRDIVLNSGIDGNKVFLIPTGIDISAFHLQTPKSKKDIRAKVGIPESAMVVGSFQKDGSGWGEGDEPKLIKGPDVFLAVIKQLKERIPELFVLLAGPSRGYVLKGLQELKVPYKHIMYDNFLDVSIAYQCLDLYIIGSRQEGGPKMLLESMATGVPLVTTRVGQAMDLVKHGENAWMTEVGDVEGLVHWSIVALQQGAADRKKMIETARQTAQENSYIAQLPLWERFMEGFVEMES